MAYVNIAEWNYDQVGDWLRGLEDSIHPYIHLFVLEKVDGTKLLHITASDLIKLHINSIGHQEIILQAASLLRNLHYDLHQENAQLLALKLSSKARSIYNELCVLNPPNSPLCDVTDVDSLSDGGRAQNRRTEKASTTTLLAVADVLSSVKALVGWLHKSPFNGLQEYDEMKSRFVELGISLATIAQRDAFIDRQSSVMMRDSCFQLAQMADIIIQDSKDPMILQPACLDVTTMKKRTDDTWGISLFSSYHGIHQISVLRALSPAHNSGKLMGGDQIIQVNYQTVIGWTSVKVTQLMQENPMESILTIKKCPRHASNLSNIYFKPFRLPSKKRTYSPWATNGFSPNRFDLHSIPNLPFIKSFDGKSAVHRVVSTEPHNVSISPPPSNPTTGSAHSLEVSDSDTHMATQSDAESDLSDDAFISDCELAEAPSSLSVRFFSARPRPHALRRATIPGATMRPTINYDQVVRGCNQKQTTLPNCSNCSNGGFDLLAQQQDFQSSIDGGTNPVDRGIDSATPSSEEMPFIDELDEKDEPIESTWPANDRRGFIDKAHPPDALPLKGDDPLLLYRTPSGGSGIGSTMVDAKARLDKAISSPAYDDYEDANKNISSSDLPKLHPVEWERPISNAAGGERGAPLSASSFKDDSTNGNVAAAAAATDMPSMTSFGEATYVNQVAVRGGADSSASDRLNRRLIRGNRRISCRDLGQGDQQGWLYRRKEHKGFLLPHRWVKRWFILNKSILYGYKDSDSLKADSLIYLPGFHVSPAAPEMKARRFAFKIFHSRGGATFYFACESAEERSRWMSQMGLSAMSSTISRSQHPHSHPSDEAYYSETDDELDDKHGFKGTSLGRSSNNTSKGNASTSNTSTSKTALSYFSSGKSQPLKFLQSSKAALSNPVPTSNFRSYVRVREPPTPTLPVAPTSPKMTSGFSAKLTTAKDGSVTLERKEVRRKNSIRDRLLHLPSSLTMDRRKSATHKQMPDSTAPGLNPPKRICTASTSENSLTDKVQVSGPPPTVCRSQSATDTGYHVRYCPPATNSPTVTPDGTDSLSRTAECRTNPDTSALQLFSHFETPLDANGIKLKCASQYYPVTLGKDRTNPLLPAFQMDLSSNSPVPPEKVPRVSRRDSGGSSPKVRPVVPPRTKFLSPSERQVPDTADSGGGAVASSPVVSRICRSKQPPNLVISPTSEDGDSPKTPFKPAMGISMIGKQRRTPTISPKEILPHYPGMEYPPTFEPESYSLTSQRGGIYSPEREPVYSQDTPQRTTRISPQNIKYPTANKSPQNISAYSTGDGYINIGDANEEFKGFHHQIYVTSPLTNQGHGVYPEGSFRRGGQGRRSPPETSHSSSQRPSPHTSFHRQHAAVPLQGSCSYTCQGPSPQGSLQRQGPSARCSPYGPGPTPHDLSADNSREEVLLLRGGHDDVSPQSSFHRPDISPRNSFRPLHPGSYVAAGQSPSPRGSCHGGTDASPQGSLMRGQLHRPEAARRSVTPPHQEAPSGGSQRLDNVSPSTVGQSKFRDPPKTTSPSAGRAVSSSQIFAWLRNS